MNMMNTQVTPDNNNTTGARGKGLWQLQDQLQFQCERRESACQLFSHVALGFIYGEWASAMNEPRENFSIRLAPRSVAVMKRCLHEIVADQDQLHQAQPTGHVLLSVLLARASRHHVLTSRILFELGFGGEECSYATDSARSRHRQRPCSRDCMSCCSSCLCDGAVLTNLYRASTQAAMRNACRNLAHLFLKARRRA